MDKIQKHNDKLRRAIRDLPENPHRLRRPEIIPFEDLAEKLVQKLAKEVPEDSEQEVSNNPSQE